MTVEILRGLFVGSISISLMVYISTRKQHTASGTTTSAATAKATASSSGSTAKRHYDVGSAIWREKFVPLERSW